MADRTDTRGEGVRRLFVGLIVIPYMILVLLLTIPVGTLLWIVNNIWQSITGSPLVAENSRIGYYLYWAQSNLQAVITGRGGVEWTP